MVRLAVVQRQHDAHRATADQEQFVAGIAAREDGIALRHAALFHALFESRQRLFLAPGKEFDLLQFQRNLLVHQT